MACVMGTVLAAPFSAQAQALPEPAPIPAPAAATPAPIADTAATTGVMDVPAGTLPAAQPTTVADPLAGNDARERTVLSTGNGRVPPPAPGGGLMEGGEIPPISAELLALTPEEQMELATQQARTRAFEGTLRQAMPLEPAEIKTVIDRYEETTKAVEAPFGNIDPKPEVRVETINLEPSALPPVVHLAPGHVTSVTVLDSTGQPWPVADVSWGGDFEVQAPDEGGHIIRISPLGGYKTGNLSLRLISLPTPVTFSLKTQPDTVDYRFDARLPMRGPNAMPEIIETQNMTSAGDGNIMMVLDGMPPEGATPLSVSGVDARTSAYKVGAKIYVRTPYSMLSPAWSEQSSSADGMKVYAIPDTPVLLLSDQGKMLRASLSGGAGGSLDAAFEAQNTSGAAQQAQEDAAMAQAQQAQANAASQEGSAQ